MERKNTTITTLNLSEEITHEEILPRLPVKSLLRFRCISKSWRFLIGSKRFIETQHQNSMKNPYFPQQRAILHKMADLPKQCSLQSLLSEEPIDLSPFDDPAFASFSTGLRVLGCYNGLVCIHKYPGRFYLWNPSTKISKKLPKIANHNLVVKKCGFGWDESSGEYKVFALVYDLSSFGGRVYSSKTKSWEKIELYFTDFSSWSNMAGVFVGGKLHWMNLGENYIIFLDLKSEVFGRIEVPFEDQENRDRKQLGKQLGQIGGCLCVLLYRNPWNDIRVWVMKESWERLMDLSLDHELLQRYFSILFIQKCSNGEIFVFDGSTSLVYDPRDNVFRFPKVCLRYCRNWYRIKYISQHVYVESLLSPEDV